MGVVFNFIGSAISQKRGEIEGSQLIKGFRYVQKSLTSNDLKRSKRICSHRQPKSNLLLAQRSARVSLTNLLVILFILSRLNTLNDNCMSRQS